MGLGVDVDILHKKLENSITKIEKDGDGYNIESDIPLNNTTENILKGAEKECDIFKDEYLDTQHILLSLLKTKNEVYRILRTMKVNYKKYEKELKSYIIKNSIEPMDADEDDNFKNYKKQVKNKTNSTPVLDNFSTDLTKRALEGKIDPVIGRDEEIQLTIKVLSRRGKNNPVLIGAPGVGKTAIAELLAQKIVDNELPESLQGLRLISLDIGALIAGAKFRGQFEERFRSLLSEINNSEKGVILFIDELHTIVSKDRSNTDAGSLLKPLLASGDLRCIGATTPDNYRRTIEKDLALNRRFQQVSIKEPSLDLSLEILKGLKENYEVHHGVIITDEALITANRLAYRYISDRCLPDKAIDLIDEASAQVRIESASKPKIIEEKESQVSMYQELRSMIFNL